MPPVVYFGYGLAVALWMRVRRASRPPRKTWLVSPTRPEVPPTRPWRKVILYTFMGGIVVTQTVRALGSHAWRTVQKRREALLRRF